MTIRRRLAAQWRAIFAAVCTLIVAGALTSAIPISMAVALAVVAFAALLLWIDVRVRRTHRGVNAVAVEIDSHRRSSADRFVQASSDLDAARDEVSAQLDVTRERLEHLAAQLNQAAQVNQVEAVERTLEQLSERIDRLVGPDGPVQVSAARLESLEHRIDTLESLARSADTRAQHLNDQMLTSWRPRLEWLERATGDLEDAVEEQQVMATTTPSPMMHRSRPVRLYWWRHPSRRLPNFGDELSRLVVEQLANRPVVHASPERCDLVAVGSVLEHVLRSDRTSQLPVWGSGFIADGDGDRVGDGDRDGDGANLVVHAVRGSLTAARFGGVDVIGDPGLLSSRLIDRPLRKHRVGLVPHFVDRHRAPVEWFESNVPDGIVISPLQPPIDVIAQIASCELIVSSSLHGMVVADSFGIPNRWVSMSDGVLGDGFKFRDYLTCYGIDTADPATCALPEGLRAVLDGDWPATYARPGIDDITSRLAAAFPDLS